LRERAGAAGRFLASAIAVEPEPPSRTRGDR